MDAAVSGCDFSHRRRSRPKAGERNSVRLTIVPRAPTPPPSWVVTVRRRTLGEPAPLRQPHALARVRRGGGLRQLLIPLEHRHRVVPRRQGHWQRRSDDSWQPPLLSLPVTWRGERLKQHARRRTQGSLGEHSPVYRNSPAERRTMRPGNCLPATAHPPIHLPNYGTPTACPLLLQVQFDQRVVAHEISRAPDGLRPLSHPCQAPTREGQPPRQRADYRPTTRQSLEWVAQEGRR